jgi:hypothetical protein
LVQNAAARNDETSSFIVEIGAHARYLAAVSLLVLAEMQCARRLNAILHHFVRAGIIQEQDRDRFDAAVTSTLRLLNSIAARLIVVTLAYLAVASIVYSQPFDQIPAWHKIGSTTAPAFSLAGWWHVLVSLPLLLVLLFGWMWRFTLWVRLLWRIARLDLHLLASHPDKAAGLEFLGYSVRAFSFVGLALAAIIAGHVAHLVLIESAAPGQHVVSNAALLLAIVALIASPLLIFSPALMRTWRRGALEYSALADRIGFAFEQKWLGRRGRLDNELLDKPDFSATTDLYSVVANVHALRLVPSDLTSIIMLGGTMLLPFVPIVFLALPFEQLLEGLKKMLF